MDEPAKEKPKRASGDHHIIGGPYAVYVLFVLVIVYLFNFIDRQIISILAEDIKADIGVSDAQIGFLYGTAFAVFYALFGIPLGRLADLWTRKSLIATGLFFWSIMTTLSGTARSFLVLGVYRMGVGVGEASASPAAYSMLSDYFPPKLRATAMAIYSSGLYIGAGVALFLGGWIVQGWNDAYAPGEAPLDLKGWHVAYFAVGIPGLLMALWVWTLREPVRGLSEGIPIADKHPHPFREFFRELGSIIPPFTIWGLVRAGAPGSILTVNLAVAAAIALMVTGVVSLAGDHAQWISLGVGIYASFSWVQSIRQRDPVAYRMIFHCKSLIFGMLGIACFTFVTYGLGFWFPPYYIRTHAADVSTVGMNFGLATAVSGCIGVTLGGFLSDWLRTKTPRARPYVGLLSLVLTVPIAIIVTMADNAEFGFRMAYIYNFVAYIWTGSGVAMTNELVLPRMRGTSAALYLLLVTFIGLALGPYTIGKVSDLLTRGGADPSTALQQGLLVSLLMLFVSGVFLILCAKNIERDETSRLERARAAGEPGV